MRYEKALLRLSTPPEKVEKMTKKDWIVLWILVIVYSVMAFVNLGSFDVPSTQYKLDQNGENIQVELNKTEDVRFIKYYAGLGEGIFFFEYSEDGKNFTRVKMPDSQKTKQNLQEDAINHLSGDMYKWNFIELKNPDPNNPNADISFRAKYINITVEKPGARINELAFCGADGAPFAIKSVKSLNATDSSRNPGRMFDEQKLVQKDHTTYLTDMYFDEVYHGRTALENIEYIYPYEITHPPLGKIILGIGIRIFGMNPFGWRFMGTLFGVLLLFAMYFMAKRLFKKTTFAFIATFLYAFDFMHFTQTRIATIDSYSCFFVMLMYYFMYKYINTNFNRDGIKKTLLPLGLCGLFFGIGAATKWLCIYAGAGLAVLFFYSVWQRAQEYKASVRLLNGEIILKPSEAYDIAACERTVATYKKNLYLTLLFCVLVFIIIPLIIYILSYIPYLLVKDKHFGWEDIWENQKYMLNYHANLKTVTPHPFQSRWYTWPLDIRPVFFFQGVHMPKGYISNISTMGNPFVWWGGFAAVIFIIVNALRRKKMSVPLVVDGVEVMTIQKRGIQGNVFGKGLVFVAIAAASEYVPWIFISRETFIYHYFETVPFLILLLTYVIRYFMEHFRHGKKIVIGYLIIVFLAFVAFYPILSGIVTSINYANAIRWLETWPFY